MFFSVGVVDCHRRMIHRMPMGDFFELQCKFADVFNPLRLTDGEIGLLTGAMIMSAGRSRFAAAVVRPPGTVVPEGLLFCS